MRADDELHEQVALTFKDLTYSVDLGKKQGTKVILDGISGCFKPGRLTALFGASGCGKTSLMDVLARRKNTGTIEGEIRFAGAPCKKENIKHLCGYVEEFDNLVETLTVEQMLMYTAELKLPTLTRAQQRERCEEVISQLRLEECRKTVIGGELVKGISGGQKKRVNIGLSLITRPPILFLDEPTTGLDSAMADEVYVIMSLLAAKGCTVVATVTSPTASAFSLFDDLFILREGQLVYGGECGAAAEYFASEVGLRPLEMGESIPEWLVDAVSPHAEVDAKFLTEKTKALVAKRARGRAQGKDLATAALAKTFRGSSTCATLEAALVELHGDGSKAPVSVPAHLRRANPLVAIYVLLKYRAGVQLKSRFRIRSRLASLWRRGPTRTAPASSAELPPISIVLTMAGVTRPLSDCFNEAIAALAAENQDSTAAAARTGVRVGASGEWFVLATGADGRVVSYTPVGAATPTECDVRLSYRDERTFAAMMDDALSPTAAVTTGRLRVSGSLQVASASEEVYVAADAWLRNKYGQSSGQKYAVALSAEQAEAVARAAEEEEAAQLQERLARAADRPAWQRWRARHLGTDMQVGSALMVVGSLAYSYYCALAVQLSAAEDLASNYLFLISSLLWLLGTAFLIDSSYPERIAGIVIQAERDARDPSRLEAMGRVERYATSSSLLLGAWNLGMGAPTFLAGAVLRTAAHPADDMTPVAYGYDLVGVYLFVATGLLVLGALPECLAQNEGSGSTYLLAALGGGRFWSVHAANDLLAGTLFFAVFVVVVLVFGLVDLIAEPSALTLWFAASQVLFAAGVLLLARSSYPDGLNRASVWGEAVTEEMVLDEQMLRGLTASEERGTMGSKELL